MKNLPKILLIGVPLLLILTGTGFFFYIKSQPLPVVEIGTVDLATVHDGTYSGEYKAGPVRAIVTVDVSGNKITAIKIDKHECGLGKKAETIIQDIEKLQSLNVDVVSGATLSSKVIVKAVEIALEKGQE